MDFKSLLRMVPTAIFALSIVGCGPNSAEQHDSAGNIQMAAPPATVETAHEHASHGPHGGGLIELGNEEYHAELVHDDNAGTVTIYLLDSKAKAAVPIEATEVTINLKHEGRGEQFTLGASSNASDPAGKSSRFVSTDGELAADLDHESADAQLVVLINGKQYRGAIEHDHEHEGDHDHSHE